ncbi:transposase [Neisseria iguanae]|uniref:transposase n=1 Tax=Neisseria iguanae TaxID=90242 RepID=UPI003CCBA3CF
MWQRQYWEHEIRNQQDLNAHINYIHINPVKHGYVVREKDWPYSSFHLYVEKEILPENWTGGESDGKFGKPR